MNGQTDSSESPTALFNSSLGAESVFCSRECASAVAEAVRHAHQRKKRMREAIATPMLRQLPLTPAPLWYRVSRSALEAVSWVEKEKRSAERVLRKLEKDLEHFHEESKVREERERKQQREARARLSAKLHLVSQRYWTRRRETFQHVMNAEFQTVKQYYDRRKQEDLLAETETLTKKLVDSMLRRRPLAGNALESGGDPHPLFNELESEESGCSAPMETRLALLDTLNGTRPLRSYQRSALKWMVHLYDSNLNGILADEMGLGKTVQTIALLCYFAQYRNDWGPHLIVVPTTVVLNWKEELQRWAPGLKVLTYHGSPKERLQCRKGWMREDAFHVCLTTYQLIVNDRSVFRRRPWGFLVLDEAHQIKNFMSKKWQSLFDLQVSYRLLLTGTPLQNSIMELWSLFHFLLPFASAFRSNEDFKEWFSNPLDDMVSGRSALNESIVRRLQSLLRPFMLRRLKRDVESQLPRKTEKVVRCPLSRRQRALYDDYMQLSDTKNRIRKGGVFSVLLALRKVCDHPDLFEERPTVSPLVLDRNHAIRCSVPRAVLLQDNSFRYRFPRSHETLLVCVADLHEADTEPCHGPRRSRGDGRRESVWEWCACSWLRLQMIFTSGWDTPELASRYHPSHFTSTSDPWKTGGSTLQPPLAPSVVSSGLLSALWGVSQRTGQADLVERHRLTRQVQEQRYTEVCCRTVYVFLPRCLLSTPPLAVTSHIMNRSWYDHYADLCPSVPQRVKNSWPVWQPVLAYVPRAITTTPPELVWAYPVHRQECFERKAEHFAPLVAYVQREQERRQHGRVPRSVTYDGSRFLSELWPLQVRRCFSFPDKYLLIHDCGKLRHLQGALPQLRAEGHRVLIFTQFVKMLNILERFLALIGMAYLRLDGSTKAEERQFNVQRFNNDPRITVMLLSTRSGGIGLNLTGADTVVFYDSDWNPTMDLQAQDRCHRIGQTRPVTIYRLISAHTVEESILEKARERKRLNNVVIRGGQFNAIAGVGEVQQDTAEPDEDASAAAMALLTMKTDLRAFFHSMDEDADVDEKAVMAEMRGAEDAEDLDALEQLEAELQERAMKDGMGEEDTVAVSGKVGASGAELWQQGTTHDEEPPLKLYKEEPALLSTVRQRQATVLSKCKTEVDTALSRYYGLFHPNQARQSYYHLKDSYKAKIDRPNVELPHFRPCL